MVLALSFIDVMNHINCFADIKPAPHPRYKSHLVMVILFMYCWIRLANILLRIFESMFLRESCLQFSFVVGSLTGFGIKATLAS